VKLAEKLVVYDSIFGNTEKIAQAIGEALDNSAVVKVSEVSQADLENLQILIVGSPTRAFRPTPETMVFIRGLGRNTLSSVKAAAFDTRIPIDGSTPAILKTLIKLFGYADTKIAAALAKTGVDLAVESDGFGVSGTEGPLIEGELERAQDWARQILM
jgi:flavodoxin I